MKRSLKEHWPFCALLLVCAALRFFPLFEYQFTYDELAGLDRTQFKSFSELIEKGVKIDAHPALVQLIIFYLVQFFGYTTWIIKLPFLLFSVGSVCYAYAFGYRNFGKQQALFSATILAFSLIFVFHAPIARMYVSGVFFCVGLLYYFFSIFFRKDLQGRNYFFLGLFALLCALNHHISSLFAFTVFASGFFMMNRENRKLFIVTALVTIVCYLPHLKITLYQLSVPGIGVDVGGWLEPPKIREIGKFVYTLFGTGAAPYYILVAVVVAVLRERAYRLNKEQFFLIIIFLLNFFTVFLYSHFRSPIYQQSVMLFAGTALVLFAGSMLRFAEPRLFAILLIAIAASLLFQTYVRKSYLSQCVRTIYEYQFKRTYHYKDLYGEKNVYPIFFDCDTLMRKIYFRKYQRKFECSISPDSIISNNVRVHYFNKGWTGKKDSLVSSIRLFSEFVSRLHCNYLVLSSSTPLFDAVVKEYFPFLIENTRTQGIRLKVYSKIRPGCEQANDDEVLYEADPGNARLFSFSASLPLTISSETEFPFESRSTYDEVAQKEGTMLLVDAEFETKGDHCRDTECCIVTVDGNTNKAVAYSAKAISDFMLRGDSFVNVYSDQFVGRQFDEVKKNAMLKTFVWNRGKCDLSLKRYNVKVIDFWPEKWHFWD
jgi:hypothetical protein